MLWELVDHYHASNKIIKIILFTMDIPIKHKNK